MPWNLTARLEGLSRSASGLEWSLGVQPKAIAKPEQPLTAGEVKLIWDATRRWGLAAQLVRSGAGLSKMVLEDALACVILLILVQYSFKIKYSLTL